MWDAATGQPIGPPLVQEGFVISAAFSPDDKTIVTASNDATYAGSVIDPPARHGSGISLL